MEKDEVKKEEKNGKKEKKDEIRGGCMQSLI